MSVIDVELDSPHLIMGRLTDIEQDLARRQNLYESAARAWYIAQRSIKKEYATALLTSEHGSVTEKKAAADLASLVCDGTEHEAEYEALKAAIRVLEQRATILMSLLKAHGRA